MEWTNNLTSSQLFFNHDITIASENCTFTIHIPSLRELKTDSIYNIMLNTLDITERLKLRSLFNNVTTDSEMFTLLLCEPKITNLQEFHNIYNNLKNGFSKIFPDFKIHNRQLYLGDYLLNDDMLTEASYIYTMGCGKTIERPPHFGPGEEQAKAFYERSLAAKAKIAKLKKEGTTKTSERDGLMDVFTLICYKFPQYTFEQLYDFTMFQINTLQSLARKIIDYEYGMNAYTAGNLKKAPNFFLK